MRFAAGDCQIRGPQETNYTSCFSWHLSSWHNMITEFAFHLYLVSDSNLPMYSHQMYVRHSFISLCVHREITESEDFTMCGLKVVCSVVEMLLAGEYLQDYCSGRKTFAFVSAHFPVP